MFPACLILLVVAIFPLVMQATSGKVSDVAERNQLG